MPALTAEQHTQIGNVMFRNGRSVGAKPNPYASRCKEWERRKANKATRDMLTEKIEMLYEPRFITFPETSELIEALVTASDARNILEVGCYSGFTSLHILRAIVGKQAKLTGIDARPAHDEEFFAKPELAPHWRFIQDWTPQCLEKLKGEFFDLVFVDSDHSLEHSEKERLALMEITKPGSIWLFHDIPVWPTPDNHEPPPIYRWLERLVAERFFWGHRFPTPEQPDCVDNYGEGYPSACNPGLGIFIRR